MVALVGVILLLVSVANAGHHAPEGVDDPNAMEWIKTELKRGIRLHDPRAHRSETKSGLQYKDLDDGTGEFFVENGVIVMIKYKLYSRADGTMGGRFIHGVFDSPFLFEMGAETNGVPLGFAEAVSSMRVGGKRFAAIPAALMYGPKGEPSRAISDAFAVLPDEDIFAYIELVGVRHPSLESPNQQRRLQRVLQRHLVHDWATEEDADHLV